MLVWEPPEIDKASDEREGVSAPELDVQVLEREWPAGNGLEKTGTDPTRQEY